MAGRLLRPWSRPFSGGPATIPSTVAPPATQPEAINERAAVDAVLAGDREAFRVLVERESATVIRACHRILGDRHEAEDAAQEAFVTAFRSLAGWRGDGPFGAWITRIAVRIALRRAQRRRDVTWIDPTNPSSRTERSGGPDPAITTLRAERAEGVRSAVSRLDEPYREVIALRFFAELSLEEIATQTGRPLGTVKTHLRRGLLRLRTSVDGGSL
jgi:RNA polymerase sigma-70 factor (ECF subfamily)